MHPRFAWSTIAVFLLTLALLVVVNVGADNDRGLRILHGWPWIFATGSIRSDDPFAVLDYKVPPLFDLSGINSVHWQALLANMLVAIIIALVFAGSWEWLQRRRKKWWQFTLLDGMVAVTACALLLGAWRLLYRDAILDRQFAESLKPELSDHDRRQLAVSLKPELSDYDRPVNRFLHGPDVPADWFWNLLGISPENCPPRRINLVVSTTRRASTRAPQQLLVDLSDESARIMGQYWNVEEVELDDLRLSPQGWEHVGKLRSTTILILANNDFGDDEAKSFQSWRNLQELILCNGELTDAGLAEFANNERLLILSLAHQPDFQGHDLARFRKLLYVEFDSLGLDDQGMAALAGLPEVSDIELRRCNQISPEACEKLAATPQLKELTIRDSPFNDRAAAALATSPSLQCLELVDTTVTDVGIERLTHLPTLQRLYVVDYSGLVTNDTIRLLTAVRHLKEVELNLVRGRKDVVDAANKAGLVVRVQNWD